MTFGTIALFGSGETAPGMTKIHRKLLGTLQDVRAINLNSPYGFQENVDQMTEKLQGYFDLSLQLPMRTLDLRDVTTASAEDLERFVNAVAGATYVFAGPGSPSYALRQWQTTALRDALLSVAGNGGVVCFSSAAALTLGVATMPVYEIYKAGADPHWLTGLDLLGAFGLSCAIVPHYNNAEGGTYDTSRCYVGERRLQELERMLPADVGVLGIDEHTAALIDLETRILQVEGKGSVHWRRAGAVTQVPAGQAVALDELGANAVSLTIATPPPQLPAASIDAAELAARAARDEALVVALEDVRTSARAAGNYAVADAIRAALHAFGVTIRDGAIAN